MLKMSVEDVAVGDDVRRPVLGGNYVKGVTIDEVFESRDIAGYKRHCG